MPGYNRVKKRCGRLLGCFAGNGITAGGARLIGSVRGLAAPVTRRSLVDPLPQSVGRRRTDDFSARFHAPSTAMVKEDPEVTACRQELEALVAKIQVSYLR